MNTKEVYLCAFFRKACEKNVAKKLEHQSSKGNANLLFFPKVDQVEK